MCIIRRRRGYNSQTRVFSDVIMTDDIDWKRTHRNLVSFGGNNMINMFVFIFLESMKMRGVSDRAGVVTDSE